MFCLVTSLQGCIHRGVYGSLRGVGIVKEIVITLLIYLIPLVLIIVVIFFGGGIYDQVRICPLSGLYATQPL